MSRVATYDVAVACGSKRFKGQNCMLQKVKSKVSFNRNRLPGKTRLRNDLLCVEWH